jgi:hypothetical protein
MMEEKTELFRTLQAKRDQLKKLDQELDVLRSQRPASSKTVAKKKKAKELESDESSDKPKKKYHKRKHSINVECEEEPESTIYQSEQSRIFDFEETGVDPNDLVPWTTILKGTHGTGTISSMTKPQKDRVDDAVYEFLSLHMHPNDVKSCKVSLGKKQIAALPLAMTEAFEYWLDEQIDSGILDKQSLDDRKKKKGTYMLY